MRNRILQGKGKYYLFTAILLIFLVSSSNAQSIPKSGMSLNANTSLTFSENRGQVVDKNRNKINDILFVGRTGAANIYLRRNGISYVFNKCPSIKGKVHFLKGGPDNNLKDDKTIKCYRLDLEFIGCNSKCNIVKEDPEESYSNYYLPQCPDGITQVKSYKRITYNDIYPGIDVVFYPGINGIEYDFNIHPGADPDKIKLKYTGADNVQITPEGNLSVLFRDGKISETAPKVYNENNGKKEMIKADFVISKNEKTISFKLGNYNTNLPITIDPSVQWSTYLGGSHSDYISVLAVDKDSDVYGVGTTNSFDFPVTPGAFQPSNGDTTYTFYNVNLVVFKFTSKGKLLWSTYYGGSGDDGEEVGYGGFSGNGPGIASDSNDNVVITSGTYSTDLPVTTGAFQTAFSGSSDAFIAKFNTNGKRVWATYYGDPKNGVIGESIAIDKGQNIYITGTVYGTGNLANSNRKYGLAIPSGSNGWQIFIAKFNPLGARTWSLIYGGNYSRGPSPYIEDYPSDINVDDSNDIIIIGNYTSSNFPLTLTTGFDSTGNSPSGSAFIVKLDSSGTRKWALTIGGLTWMVDVAADVHNNIYAVGWVQPTFKAAKNAQFTSSTLNDDGFLIKYDGAGNELWGTPFGGSGPDQIDGVIADGNENVTICGVTGSTDLPVKNPIQKYSGGGGADGFISKFDKSGSLIWSTYFGGNGLDNPTDIERDSRGNLYFCGLNQSGDYPTKNAYQDSSNGLNEGIITKISDCSNLYSDVKIINNNLCIGDTVTLKAESGFDSYKWNNGDSTPSIKVTKSGSYYAALSYKAGCSGTTEVINLNFTSPPSSSIIAGGPLSFCGGDSVSLTATGSNPRYSWSSGARTVQIEAKKTGEYKLTTYNGGCSVSDSVYVNVSRQPSPVIKASGSLVLCHNNPVVLDAGSGYNSYKWSNGATSQKITVNIVDSYRVTVDSTNGCNGSSSWVQVQKVMPQIVGNKSPIICNDDTLVLDAGNGFLSYFWNTGQTTRYIKVSKPGKYYAIVILPGGCIDTSQAIIVINSSGTQPVISGTNNFIVCGNNPVILDAGSGYNNYLWNNGDTFRKIIVNTMDSFRVTVNPKSACPATSAWVHVQKSIAQIISNRPPKVCNGDSVILDAGFGFTSYHWSDGETTELIKVGKSGNYYVITTANGGCVDTSKMITVVIYPAPPKPVISENDNLLNSTKSAQYQWIKNGSFLKGETGQKLSQLSPGFYVVETIDSNGCTAYSDSFLVGGNYFNVFPNPTIGQLHIEAGFNQTTDVSYYLVDMLGQVLLNFDDGNHIGTYTKTIDMETYAYAMYILRIKAGDKIYTEKIIKAE